MKKKYEFTGETIKMAGRTLHKIRALMSFGYVESGCLGGFIEKEENLSHEGKCWVYGNAKVYGDAKVYENAEIFDESTVIDNAQIYGDAKIENEAFIIGCAKVHDNAQIYGETFLDDNAEICEFAVVDGADVRGNSRVCGYAIVRDCDILEDAFISSSHDILAIDGIGYDCLKATFYKNAFDGISVYYDAYVYTIEEFEEFAKQQPYDEFYEKQMLAAIEFAKLSILRTGA